MIGVPEIGCYPRHARKIAIVDIGKNRRFWRHDVIAPIWTVAYRRNRVESRPELPDLDAPPRMTLHQMLHPCQPPPLLCCNDARSIICPRHAMSIKLIRESSKGKAWKYARPIRVTICRECRHGCSRR